jgi:photosystem II stability/assembly factor-like uncharacterized protein
MRKIISISIACLWLVSIHKESLAQIELKGELAKQLNGKRNFREIISVVHSYYSAQRNKLKNTDTSKLKYLSRQIKFWNRWEWYNRPRVDENGNITNATEKNWEIFDQAGPSALQRTSEINSSYGQWIPIGPLSYTRIGGGHGGGLGRVNCIAFHPSDPNILYVGCAYGGLWRTLDHGASWVSLSDHIPNTAISGIVVSHADPNTLYILTGDGDISFAGANEVGSSRSSIGVLKSTDGGQNWFKTRVFPGISGTDYSGYKLIQDPVNANILFAATTLGIFRTDNAGLSWTNVQAGNFTDIEFKPGNHNIMYAVSREFANAFYRSTDNGLTWDHSGIAGVPFAIERLALAVSPNQPNWVYMLAGPRTSSSSFKGVYLSMTEGLSFQLTTDVPNILGGEINGVDDRDQSFYDHCIAVDPTNAANVVTGGINIWGSTNSGQSFTYRTHWSEDITPQARYVHADIHNLDYNPLNNYLYTCTDGGVAYSTDKGVNWSRIWNGLQIMQFYHLTGLDAFPSKFIGGTQDNGTNYRRTFSSNYYHVEGADGYSGLIDYADTSILYFTGNNDVRRSTDGGITDMNNVSIVPFNQNIEKCFPLVAMNVVNHATIYAGFQSGFSRSLSQGDVWTYKGPIASNIALTVCPSNSTRIYVAGDRLNDFTNIYRGGDVCYRTDDGGDTWDSLHIKTGFPNTVSTPLTDIAVHPANSAFVWLTTGGFVSGQKVFFSSDAGNNWTNISGSLPNVPAISIAADVNGNVYVGTDIGVFYRGAAMNDWIAFYNGLPKTIISDLVINNTTGTITAATHGRGVFQSSLFSPCIPSIALAGSLTGNHLYEANSWVSSTQTIYGGSGTEIYYKGGDSVIMKNGFEVKEGTFFKAYLGPCASGIPTQSVIATNYQVSNTNEIVKEPLVRTNDQSVKESQEIMPAASGSDKEIKLSLSQQQFTQVYFQEEDTQEILLWLVRSSLSAGQYRLKYNDTKLKNGKVNLIIDIGGNKKIMAVR